MTHNLDDIADILALLVMLDCALLYKASIDYVSPSTTCVSPRNRNDPGLVSLRNST